MFLIISQVFTVEILKGSSNMISSCIVRKYNVLLLNKYNDNISSTIHIELFWTAVGETVDSRL